MDASSVVTASVTASFSRRELEFYENERARLAEDGVTNYDDQSAEIARRWTFVSAHSAGPTETVLPFALTEKQMTSGKMYLHSSQPGRFVYRPKKRIIKRHSSQKSLLDRLKKDTLVSICSDLDMTVSGNKDRLVERITNFNKTADASSASEDESDDE